MLNLIYLREHLFFFPATEDLLEHRKQRNNGINHLPFSHLIPKQGIFLVQASYLVKHGMSQNIK